MEKLEEWPACMFEDEMVSAPPPDCGPFMGSGAPRELPCFAGWTASIPACLPAFDQKSVDSALSSFLRRPPHRCSQPSRVYLCAHIRGGLLCLSPPRDCSPARTFQLRESPAERQRANIARGRRRYVPTRDRPLLRTCASACLQVWSGGVHLQVRTPAGIEYAHLRIDM